MGRTVCGSENEARERRQGCPWHGDPQAKPLIGLCKPKQGGTLSGGARWWRVSLEGVCLGARSTIGVCLYFFARAFNHEKRGQPFRHSIVIHRVREGEGRI